MPGPGLPEKWASSCFPALTSMSRKYRSNKRRRSQAFPEEEETVVLDGEDGVQEVVNGLKVMEVDAAEEDTIQPDDVTGREQPEESEEELKRKQEIWEVFQEERHEGAFTSKAKWHSSHWFIVLDQLPLSLQRSYTLISELDDQVNSTSAPYHYFISCYNDIDYNARILSTLKEYVAIRKSIAAIAEPLSNLPPEPSSPTDPTQSPLSPDTPINGISKPTARIFQVTRPTRYLLTSVAQMADDNVRSSREKLNIARFACGLVCAKFT